MNYSVDKYNSYDNIKNKMIKNWIQKIENSPLSLWQSIFLIYIASFFRGFLENYINSDNQYHLMGVIDTFSHYPLWFIGVFLCAFILLKISTKEKMEKISKIGAIFSFIIIIAPIIDILIGKPTRYLFITGTFGDLLKSFLTFFGSVSNGAPGASLGLKIEILVGLIFAGYYVFCKTRKIFRSLFVSFILYFIIFVFASIPTIAFYLYSATADNNSASIRRTASNFYYAEEIKNSVTDYRTFIVDKNNFESLRVQNIKNQYSITTSIIFLVIDVVILAWWFYLFSKEKFLSAIKNFRYLRFVYYYIMIFLGIYLGIKFSGRLLLGSLFDIASLMAIILSFFFAGLFSIWENDEVDIEIDKISNKNRPFAKESYPPALWRDMKYLFLFISLNFAFLAGLYALNFILLFLIIYHIYSFPPLRLKRFLGVSSLLIASNAVIVMFLGFFFASGTENLLAFPCKYALFIFGSIFLVENIKNIKDTEGDKKSGIKTLSVVLGEKKAKLILSIFTLAVVLMIPFIFFLNIPSVLTSLSFGAIFIFLINRKDFEEKYIFIAYFAYVFVLICERLLLK